MNWTTRLEEDASQLIFIIYLCGGTSQLLTSNEESDRWFQKERLGHVAATYMAKETGRSGDDVQVLAIHRPCPSLLDGPFPKKTSQSLWGGKRPQGEGINIGANLFKKYTGGPGRALASA